MTDVYEAIEQIPGVAARQDEMLSLHTTFAVGGPCNLMVWVSDAEALKKVLALAREHALPVTVLGKGSNVLVRDGGIDGLVLRLVDDLAAIDASDRQVTAGAGAGVAEVVSKATASGIGGLEFLAGIPGTMGGAVVTNAGSRNDWVSKHLVGLRALSRDLEPVEVGVNDLSFGYRYSSIGANWIVTEVTLAGHACSVEDARRRVENYLTQRQSTQPAGEHTAGCVFKNPEGEAAGRLIDLAGLKGAKIGGAQVSTVHANWVVNAGGATAGEILELIGLMREKVKEAYDIDLELEIKVMGRE